MGLLSSIGSLGMALPMVISGFATLQGAIAGTTLAESASAVVTTAKIAALDAEKLSTELLAASKDKDTLATYLGITAD
jgi:hypothetical protein